MNFHIPFEAFPDLVDEQGEPVSLPLYLSDFPVGEPMDGERMFALLRSRGANDQDLRCLYLYLRDTFIGTAAEGERCIEGEQPTIFAKTLAEGERLCARQIVASSTTEPVFDRRTKAAKKRGAEAPSKVIKFRRLIADRSAFSVDNAAGLANEPGVDIERTCDTPHRRFVAPV